MICKVKFDLIYNNRKNQVIRCKDIQEIKTEVIKKLTKKKKEFLLNRGQN